MDVKPENGIPTMPKEEIVKLLETSLPRVQRYLVGLYVNGRRDIFSGIYIKCCGYEGILTAWHCLKDWGEEPVSFLILENWHSFMVSTCYLERLCIAYSRESGRPDLAFIIIKESGITSELKRLGIEFYDLEANWIRLNEVLCEPYAKAHWVIAGTPEETVIQRNVVAQPNVKPDLFFDAQSMLLRTNFVQRRFQGEYDYLTLKPISGMGGFPERFKGMSGGGIWYLQLKTEDNNCYEVVPILAGMLCWDSKNATAEEGHLYREVEGHGWDSIYAFVQKALSEKRAKEKLD